MFSVGEIAVGTRVGTRPARVLVLVVGLLLGLAGGLVAPSVAQANDNPIDWRVFQVFYDAQGADIPLRYGQHDESEAEQGFGKYHIEDGHGTVPSQADIQAAIVNPEYCEHRLDGRVECNSGYLVVVYQPLVDPRSEDSLPFGIITAFYYLPCLAGAPAEQRLDCPDPPGVPPLPAGTSLRYTGPTGVVNGSPAQLSAVLRDDLGTPVAGRTVRFALGGGAAQQSCAGTTDRSGAASCAIGAVNQPPGTVPLTVSFAGDGGFKAAGTTVQLAARSGTKLTYTGPGTIVNGSAAQLSASLTDLGGNAVANRTVRFELGAGAGQQSCTGTTDGGGVARCAVDAVDQPPAPTVGLAVRFAGDAAYLESTLSTDLQLRTPTTLTYAGPARIANGVTTAFSSALKDFKGRPVADRQVSVVLGAGTTAQTCAAASDAQGVATCSIGPVRQPLDDTATVPLSAAFGGDTIYLSSNTTTRLLLQHATGRSYGLSAQVDLPLLPPIGVAPQPDTGPVRTADATVVAPPCKATVTAVVLTARALCATVATTLAPGTATSTATVEEATIGLPGVPVIGVSGLTATAASSCGQASGSTTLTLTIAGVPTPVPVGPNVSIGLAGGARLVVNEQTPVSGADRGIAVTGVRVIAAGGATEVVLASTRSAMHNCVS